MQSDIVKYRCLYTQGAAAFLACAQPFKRWAFFDSPGRMRSCRLASGVA